MSLQLQLLGWLWCPCHSRATTSSDRHSLQGNRPCFRSCTSLTEPARRMRGAGAPAGSGGRRGAALPQLRQCRAGAPPRLLAGLVARLQQHQAPPPKPGRDHQQCPRFNPMQSTASHHVSPARCPSPHGINACTRGGAPTARAVRAGAGLVHGRAAAAAARPHGHHQRAVLPPEPAGAPHPDRRFGGRAPRCSSCYLCVMGLLTSTG